MIDIKAIKNPYSAIESIIDNEVNNASLKKKKLLFVVPETAKASIERILFDKVLSDENSDVMVGDTKVTGSLIDYDVISFIKLSERIVASCGQELESKSNDLLLRNVIYRIFMMHGDEFKTFSKYIKRFEYIDMLIHLLGDFTRYGVSTDNLDEVLNNAKDEDSFYSKVYDLRLLLSYISETNEKYGYTLLDSYLNKASDLLSKISKDKALLKKRIYSGIRELTDTRIVIYGFGSTRSLTPQETNLIENLSALGSEIVIYPLCDLENTDCDLYYFGKQLIESLSGRRILNSINQYDVTNESTNDLSKMSYAYAFDSALSIPKESQDNSVEFIKMNDCDDLLSFVCNEIIRLTRDKKNPYRYKDIRVFCPDDAVTERFKGIMRLYELDPFIDRSITLNQTPAMRYVNVLLELPLHGYPIENVLRLFRTGLAPVSSDIIDYYENFCKANNIKFEDRIFDEPRYDAQTDSYGNVSYFKMYIAGKYIEDGGKYLKTAVLNNTLIPIKDALIQLEAASTLSAKAKVLMNHLDSLSSNIESLRNEYLDRNDTDTASAIVRGYKELMSLLSAFASPVNDVEISLKQFASLINVDMRNKVIGTIPLTADSIEIVNESSACYTPCKVLFMVGCNDSNFPHKGMSDGIMNNNELLRLNQEISVELPDKSLSQSKEEFVRSALILNMVSDKVYMFSLESEVPSSVIEFFMNSCGMGKFENLPRTHFETPIYGLPVTRRHDYLNASIDPTYVKELFDSAGHVSVSSIEKFNKCALNYMLDSLLKIRRRDDKTSVQLNDVGTLVHDMFENSLKDLVNEYDTVDKIASYKETLTEGILESLADKYFNLARLHIDSPDRNSSMYEILPGIKVKRIFKRAFPELISYCINEGYIPSQFELDVTKLDVPFNVTTDNGLVFSFNGFIDRVDTNEEGKLRIVDYKTGSKKIDIKKFISGVQIQLFAYALALSKQNDDLTIDNVGYIEAVLSPDSASEKRARLFDYEKSEFDFSNISDPISHTEFIIKNSCNDIANGRADSRVNSHDDKSCSYCPFRGLCGNNPSRPDVRVINTDIELTDEEKKQYKGNKTGYNIAVMKYNERKENKQYGY